ncbi:MAG: metalloregulator ArsR/SmtB family transcription factor [Aestuariivirgaceae bacterium]|nr:metalloregulator ArsR/SmtB family transcription factor [Aestuariivirgaceae bacterium]
MKLNSIPTPVPALEARAEEAAALLLAMANPRRLMVLCSLVEKEERPAGELAALAGISPAALSQHLGRMRAQGLVESRRAGQTIHYRLASPQVRAILQTLYGLFCLPK